MPHFTLQPRAARAFLQAAAALALLFCAGCGGPVMSEPAGLTAGGQGLLTGLLAKPLERDLRVIVYGRTDDGPDPRLPVPGATVRFTVHEQPEGARGAAFRPGTTTTDASGLAVARFIVGDKPGLYRIRADLPDYPDIDPVNLTVIGGVLIEGTGQDGLVGKTLEQPLSVVMESAPGRPMAEGEGLVRFMLMGAPEGTALSSGLRPTGADGRATAEIRLGRQQGRVAVGVTVLRGIPGGTTFLPPVRTNFFAIDVWAVAVSLFGGLALFLYGMRMMSEELQFVAGDKLRDLLNLLTTNRFMAVGAGATVTALIQSSSACSVMVVGFVNAGLMRLEQAIGVIMGANIGTTITAQIISLRLSVLAFPAIAVGVAVLLFAKRQKTKSYAGIVIGFGVLFLGMNIMSSELGQLRDSETVVSLFKGLESSPGPDGFIPFWRFLKAVGAGLLVTLVLQSSSATIGLLLTVSAAGLIEPYAAFGILLGDNIGTTITAVLASIGAGAHARRAACFHVSFNVIGVCIMILLNYVDWPGRPGRPIFMEFANILTPGDVFRDGENLSRFIANAHTMFNVTCTSLFVWFIPQFARLCRAIVKADPAADGREGEVRTRLEPHLLSMPSLALQQVWSEVGVMLEKARAAQNDGFQALMSAPESDWSGKAKTAQALEKETDELKAAVTKYLSGISLTILNESQSEMFPHLVRTVNDAERVADLGKHLSKLAKRVSKRSLSFTDEAVTEITEMLGLVNTLLELAEKTVNINADGIERTGGGAVLRAKLLEDGLRLDKTAKAKATELRKNHERRHEAGRCDVKAGVIFLDVAAALARSAGCAVNIVQAACHSLDDGRAAKGNRISRRLTAVSRRTDGE